MGGATTGSGAVSFLIAGLLQTREGISGTVAQWAGVLRRWYGVLFRFINYRLIFDSFVQHVLNMFHCLPNIFVFRYY